MHRENCFNSIDSTFVMLQPRTVTFIRIYKCLFSGQFVIDTGKALKLLGECKWPGSMRQDRRLASNGMARVHLPGSIKSGTSQLKNCPIITNWSTINLTVHVCMCVSMDVSIHSVPVGLTFRLKAFPSYNKTINQSINLSIKLSIHLTALCSIAWWITCVQEGVPLLFVPSNIQHTLSYRK